MFLQKELETVFVFDTVEVIAELPTVSYISFVRV